MKSFALWSLASVLVAAQQVTEELCSEINTSDSPPNRSTFLSRNFCVDKCKGEFAYAVVANTQCWCSNYTPGSKVANNKCNSACPGFPIENCGGTGLFTYLLINKELVKGPKGSATTGPSTTENTEIASTASTAVSSTNGKETSSVPSTTSTQTGTTTGQSTGSSTTAPAQTSGVSSTTTGGTPQPTSAGNPQVSFLTSILTGALTCSLGALLLSY